MENVWYVFNFLVFNMYFYLNTIINNQSYSRLLNVNVLLSHNKEEKSI